MGNILNKPILLSDKELLKLAEKEKFNYKTNEPFPNISFQNFFEATFLEEVLNDFPDLKSKGTKFNNPNEKKNVSVGEKLFGDKTKQLTYYLNSQPFLEFLSELTGIKNLIPDPYMIGGGYHETLPGGFLKIHADFNKHKTTKLDRRLNLLVYLNKDWQDDYGGHFELWDKNMEACVTKVKPSFNTIAIFSTTSTSYHGLPEPLTCPETMSRKSLALYYYTNGRPKQEINELRKSHGTIFKATDNDKEMKRFNQVKNLIEDVTPPILFRTLKSFRKK
jgi:hypothetical protein